MNASACILLINVIQYAGHYKGVPCVTIVKCGTEEEADAPKAGNRGKRDSQVMCKIKRMKKTNKIPIAHFDEFLSKSLV